MDSCAPGGLHLLDGLGLDDLRDDVLSYLLHLDHVIALVDVLNEVLEAGVVGRLHGLSLLLLSRKVAHESKVDVVRVAQCVHGGLEHVSYQELPEDDSDGRALGYVARDARAQQDLAGLTEEVELHLGRLQVRIVPEVWLEREGTMLLALKVYPAEMFEMGLQAVHHVLGDELHRVYLTHSVDKGPQDVPHLWHDAVEEPLMAFGHNEVCGGRVVLYDEVQDLFDVFVHVGREEDGFHDRRGEDLDA